MVYTYSIILLSSKKEENSAICDNINKSVGYYGKWNMAVTEGLIWHDFSY